MRHLRTCKACQLCRLRKVKCDGQRPTCGLCQQLSQTCFYTADARQTSRATKDGLRAMSNKIAKLEDTIETLKRHNRSSSLPPEDPGPYPSKTAAPVPGGSAHTPNFDMQPQVATVMLPDRDSFMPDIDDTPVQHGASPINEQNHPRDFDQQTVVSSDSAKVSPASNLYTSIESEGSISVHGPTSTIYFHDSSLQAACHGISSDLRDPTAIASGERRRIEDIKAELFAFSALERQKEYTYVLEERYDLDGVTLDNASHLLDIHWNQLHYVHLLSYRPAVMSSLVTGGPYMNKLLLNAIYYSSSLNSDRTCFHDDAADRRTVGLRFLRRFKALLATEIENPTVANVVALLLMSSTLVFNGRQTTAWLYSGLAYRMITDLGLHLDPAKIQTSSFTASQDRIQPTAVDLEIRRRIYWGAYVADKFQSLYLGRPAALSATGLEPPKEFLDTYEEMELWSPYVDPQHPSPLLSSYAPQPSYALSTFRWMIRLMEISSHIMECFYMPRASEVTSSAALSNLLDLESKLDDWYKHLPSHLRFEPGRDRTPPQHRLNLINVYHTLRILLHRPFLPVGHLSHLQINVASAQEIANSAAIQIYELAKINQATFTFRRTPFFSYNWLIAATFLPCPYPSDINQQARQQMIIFFLNALKDLQTRSSVDLRRPIMIIRDLVERAGIDMVPATSAQNALSSAAPVVQSTVSSNCGNDADTSCQSALLSITYEQDEDLQNLCSRSSDWLSLDWLSLPVGEDNNQASELFPGLFQ